MMRAKYVVTRRQLAQALGLPPGTAIDRFAVTDDPHVLAIHVHGEELPLQTPFPSQAWDDEQNEDSEAPILPLHTLHAFQVATAGS